MTQDNLGRLLSDVDDYIARTFSPQDEALSSALEDSRRAGLPEIHISPAQGRLMQLLAEISGSRRVLEIGTLGGYSTIYLARALPENGSLVSLELDEEYARLARANIERAGLSEKVDVRVGDARALLSEMRETFDLVFIDADKEGYPAYLDHALRLSRSGSLILADNTIFGGAVIEGSEYADAEEEGVYLREFNDLVAADERLSATIIPLLRERVDGMTVCRVR